MRFDRDARRRGINWLVMGVAFACVVLALIPLGSILYTAVSLGSRVLSVTFLTGPETVPCSFQVDPNCTYGGVWPAISGSLVLIGLSALIAMPVGILAGIYLSEYAPRDKLRVGRPVSFFSDVMTGFPSIVVGVFVYSLFYLFAPGIVFSALSGSVALAIIMIPLVTRTTEEALRLVPTNLREAALALGIPRYRATLHVVLSTGRATVITGAILAVMRAAGETAPLLITAFGNPHGFQGFTQPTEALGPLIYTYGESPWPNQIADAWGMSLVLIFMMVVIGVGARLALRRKFG
ncbi:MAG TPA: phosphate ABC transporter permease PstA [Thermoplasmata archaeon]|nr:phosphate ABC transporter permease PstA [Thermoplasmata archaeon]